MWGRRVQGISAAKTKMIKAIQRGKRPNQMVIQQEGEDEQQPLAVDNIRPALQYEHPHTRITSGLAGINSTPYYFSVISMGNTDGTALFTLDVSSLVSGNRALLSITGFRTMLLNYAATDFPAVYSLTCAQIDGMYDENG